MMSKVYFNSTSKYWSIINPKTGLIDKSQKTLYLILKNVEFKVSEKIRQYVICRKRKFICAVACGEVVVASPVVLNEQRSERSVRVTFNPYKNDTFIEADSCRPIYNCDYLVMIIQDKKPFLFAYSS